jgi:hypothetical protein
MRIDSERGSFLAETLVIVMLLGLITALTLRLSFARAVLSRGADQAAITRQRVLGVESHLDACLEGTEFGRTNCDLPAAPGCPLATIDGKAVTVVVSGVPPLCRIKISVAE